MSKILLLLSAILVIGFHLGKSNAQTEGTISDVNVTKIQGNEDDVSSTTERRKTTNLDVPKARVLPEFKRLAHGLRSGNISILDAKTFSIPDFHYDGKAPDAYFWVGCGTEPHEHGFKVPNEVGSIDNLHGYKGEDIQIRLPDGVTVYQIDWLAVWCVKYGQNFGHVLIPKDLNVPTVNISTDQMTHNHNFVCEKNGVKSAAKNTLVFVVCVCLLTISAGGILFLFIHYT